MAHPLDIGEERGRQGVGVSLRTVSVALVVFYVCGVLLNGVHLYENSARLPLGRVRTFWMKVSAPAAWLSRSTRATGFRSGIEQATGKEQRR